MKNFLSQNWLKSVFLLFIFVTTSFFFYWFQLRPTQIRESCADLAIQKITANNLGKSYIPVADRVENNTEDFNNYLERCLLEHGLEK